MHLAANQKLELPAFSRNQMNFLKFFSLTFRNSLRIGALENCLFIKACASSEEGGS